MILDWKIMLGAVGRSPKLQRLAPGPCRNERVGDGKPVTILSTKLIWPGKSVTFQTRAPTLKCDGF